MNVEEFVKLLDGVHQTSRGWSACCPGHDDSNPSLGISLGNDGRILVHCFAGCSAQEICDALGLRVRDLFPVQKSDPRVWKKQRRQEREWEQERRQRYLEGFRIDLLRDAMNLIHAARGIDISGWNPERLDRELNRLACAYTLLEKESCDEHQRIRTSQS